MDSTKERQHSHATTNRVHTAAYTVHRVDNQSPTSNVDLHHDSANHSGCSNNETYDDDLNDNLDDHLAAHELYRLGESSAGVQGEAN